MFIVAPLVGAWIETPKNQGQGLEVRVAPLVGAWIETTLPSLFNAHNASHPSWVRGLKHTTLVYIGMVHNVAPLVGAWIETRVRPAIMIGRNVAPLVGAWIET